MNFDKLLKKVSHPTRYIGKEVNAVYKNIETNPIRFAFAFPDLYEVGMSHLGMHIIYYLLNSLENTYCERAFMPADDMEVLMKDSNTELFTLESRSPLKAMDFIGFTLQYELSYTNILKMLELSNIPMLSSERTNDHPIIIGGGPCGYNPEPIAEFFDLFAIGESEELLPILMNLYESLGRDKEKFLQKAAEIQGVYVPGEYEVTYLENGSIDSVKPKREIKTQKVISFDLDANFYPDKLIVPYMDTVHDRAMVEIFRGCTKGCRFCQAGMIYRPVRERSADKIVDLALRILENTGYEELSLTSLSTLDHSQIKEVITRLMENLEDKRIGLSLPSLRLDSFSIDVIRELQKVRKSSLTFAPEAGTQRMRDIINKGVTEDNLREALVPLFAEGWDKIKLYFMVGLPYETMEDVLGIVDLAYMVSDMYRENSDRKRLALTVSASCFVPKPFTPFQWMRQDAIDEMLEKELAIKHKLRGRQFTFNYHDPETSYLEGVFARGDRKLAKVLLKANEMGIKMDGWQEFFDYDKWMEAFEASGVDPDFYLRERSYEEVLPWDHIESGVDKNFLIKENEKAKNEQTTKDCRLGSIACGVNQSHLGGVC